jgi:hypothetical protein
MPMLVPSTVDRGWALQRLHVDHVRIAPIASPRRGGRYSTIAWPPIETTGRPASIRMPSCLRRDPPSQP